MKSVTGKSSIYDFHYWSIYVLRVEQLTPGPTRRFYQNISARFHKHDKIYNNDNNGREDQMSWTRKYVFCNSFQQNGYSFNKTEMCIEKIPTMRRFNFWQWRVERSVASRKGFSTFWPVGVNWVEWGTNVSDGNGTDLSIKSLIGINIIATFAQLSIAQKKKTKNTQWKSTQLQWHAKRKMKILNAIKSVCVCVCLEYLFVYVWFWFVLNRDRSSPPPNAYGVIYKFVQTVHCAMFVHMLYCLSIEMDFCHNSHNITFDFALTVCQYVPCVAVTPTNGNVKFRFFLLTKWNVYKHTNKRESSLNIYNNLAWFFLIYDLRQWSKKTHITCTNLAFIPQKQTTCTMSMLYSCTANTSKAV